MAVFGLQRAINNYPREPLTAILRSRWANYGNHWNLRGPAEYYLYSGTNRFAAGLEYNVAIFLARKKPRIALYRAIGARPLFILLIIGLEL